MGHNGCMQYLYFTNLVYIIIVSCITESAEIRTDSVVATGASPSDNTPTIVGGVIAVVIILALAATTALIVALVLRNRRAEFEVPHFKNRYIQKSPMSLYYE